MHPILTIHQVSKSFGKVNALSGVSLEIYPGEVHAIVGENGAGKSTLMNILAGQIRPDAGVIKMDGVEVPQGHPTRDLGIGMVHQHFMLVPEFTEGENIALSHCDQLYRPLDTEEVLTKASQMAEELGWPFDQDMITSELSVGSKQRLEILKALIGETRLLILDEPTAVLTPEESNELLGILQRIKQRGVAIILIAHKLSEVMQVFDRVSVLRRGQLVGGGVRNEVNQDQISDWILGESLVNPDPRSPHLGKVVLSVDGITVLGDRGSTAISRLSLELHSGELIGIGGVDGNGQLELAEALVGIRPTSGLIKREDSIGYIPQDRQMDGLALNMSIEENLLIGALTNESIWKGFWLQKKKARSWSQELVKRYDIRAEAVDQEVGALSGGNQQKVSVARVLSQKPSIIVAMNPTRGLDIKAAQFVQTRLRDAAEQGAGVILISSDTDELVEWSDRIYYLNRGVLADHREGAIA